MFAYETQKQLSKGVLSKRWNSQENIVLEPLFKYVADMRASYSRGRSTRYSDVLIFWYFFILDILTAWFFYHHSRCCKDIYVNSLFPWTATHWNSLPIECFPLTYHVSGFKTRINRHLLTVAFNFKNFVYVLTFLCFFFL